MIRNANGDVLQVGVPRRRGTGPKASIKAFLAAYDAWTEHFLSKDADDMSYEELCEDDRLFDVMQAARAEVRGVMGLG